MVADRRRCLIQFPFQYALQNVRHAYKKELLSPEPARRAKLFALALHVVEGGRQSYIELLFPLERLVDDLVIDIRTVLPSFAYRCERNPLSLRLVRLLTDWRPVGRTFVRRYSKIID
jgi:hypothetical protein